MRTSFRHLRRALLLTAGCMALALPARANETISVVTFGGAFENAANRAWFEPFTAETGIRFSREQYSGGLARLRGMVQARNPTWDLVDLESNDAITACDEGLIQKLDPAMLDDAGDFLPGAVMPCAVASMVWATVFAYDTTRIAQPPTTIADFFDLQRFPGNRGMRRNPKVILEWALIADGVPPADVYRVLGTREGVDRAFAKLSTIRRNIVWWEAGAQAPQLLADGAVAMTMAYNGRIGAAQKQDGRPFAIVWDAQMYDYEWWGIPAGARNAEAARRFIAFASRPERLGQLSNYISYAPPRRAAAARIDPVVLPTLPTAPANFGNSLQINAEFWADNFDTLNARFLSWLGQ